MLKWGGGCASKISQNSDKNSIGDFAQNQARAKGANSSQINVHFFDAIDGLQPEFSSHIRPFLNKLLWGRELSSGELGCFSSHYSLWLRCVQKNAPIIVLEDDVILEAHFIKSLDEIIKSDFEYVRFGGLFKVDSKHIISHFYEAAPGISGAQGYYLTPRAAQKFIAHAKSWIMPVDDYMDSFFMHDVRNVVFKPYLIKGGDLESTINGRAKRKFSIFKITREIYRISRQARKILYHKF